MDLLSDLEPVAASSIVGDTAAYVVRVALKLEVFLDELIGLAGELRVALPQVVASLDSVSRSVGNLDAVTPVIQQLPSTQQDVRVAVETLETLVGLANLGIGQLEAIPGARLVRRRITKALSEQRTG